MEAIIIPTLGRRDGFRLDTIFKPHSGCSQGKNGLSQGWKAPVNAHGTLTLAAGSQTTAGNCVTTDSAAAWYNGRNGKFNSSLNFDGTDDKVVVGSVGAVGGNTAFTISLWFNHSVMTTGGMALYAEDNGTGCPPCAYIDVNDNGSAGNLEAEIYDDAGINHGISTGNLGLNDGNWHHVALVQTSKSLIELFIDGLSRGIDTTTIGAYNPSNFTIGSFSNSNFFKGSLDEIRIYNYALTQAQIKTVYNENSAVRFGPLTGSP